MGWLLDQFGMLSKFLGLVIWVDEDSNSCSIGFKTFSSCGFGKFPDFLFIFGINVEGRLMGVLMCIYIFLPL